MGTEQDQIVGLGVKSDEPSTSTTAEDRAAEEARLWVA
jgi:hypothetical protein